MLTDKVSDKIKRKRKKILSNVHLFYFTLLNFTIYVLCYTVLNRHPQYIDIC